MSRLEEWWVEALLPLWLAAAAFALGLAWSGHDLPPPRPPLIGCVL